MTFGPGLIDGVLEQDGGRVYRVRDLVEKPPMAKAPSDLAIIGRYILTPDIFVALENTARDEGGDHPAGVPGGSDRHEGDREQHEVLR